MVTNPIVGMWLGGMHAWMRAVHIGTGAWMLDRKRDANVTDEEAVPSQSAVPARRPAAIVTKA
ncbi:hypothetical protein GCM10011320_46890 [Neoroseomonas lacus]|uniref:Uncharacterized protein n=2 Tax=Neoroseomonas lacus TaxID=287609 RepID=A0A917NVU7_9PROT|nr:hypothetical protein GCM10011320_46890 [Neoroseomonas lacus]